MRMTPPALTEGGLQCGVTGRLIQHDNNYGNTSFFMPSITLLLCFPHTV